MADFGNAAMQGFQTGYQSQGPSTMGVFVTNLMDRMTKMQQARAEVGLKSQSEIQTQQALLPMKEASATRLMQKKAELFPPQPRALSGDTAGKLTFALHGARMAGRAKSILFPTGEAKSFNRAVTASAKTPWGLGQLFQSSSGKQDTQDLEFSLSRAVTAAVFLQSGVTVRPDEALKAAKDFIANAVADPDSAKLRIDELERISSDAARFIDPTGTYSTLTASPFEPRMEADDGSADADEWEVLQ